MVHRETFMITFKKTRTFFCIFLKNTEIIRKKLFLFLKIRKRNVEYFMEGARVRYLHTGFWSIRNRKSERSERVRFPIQTNNLICGFLMGKSHDQYVCKETFSKLASTVQTKHYCKLLTVHNSSFQFFSSACLSVYILYFPSFFPLNF